MGIGQTEAAISPAAAPAPDSSVATDTGAREEHADGSASAARSSELNERGAFRISLVRNARYHEDRERFFARIHRTAMFVVVLSGSAAFASARATPILAAVITLAGLLDLVFDVSGKARLHASLRRQIFDLLAQTEDESRQLVQLREQAVQIYADEPPCMHAVNAVAYNGAMAAAGRPEKYQFALNWYHRWFRHVWSFASSEFKTNEELATGASKSHASTV